MCHCRRELQALQTRRMLPSPESRVIFYAGKDLCMELKSRQQEGHRVAAVVDMSLWLLQHMCVRHRLDITQAAANKLQCTMVGNLS